MEMCLKGIGRMTKPMERGFIHMSMEQSMKANGKMTFNMDTVSKHGSKGLSTKAPMNKEKNTGLGDTSEVMAAIMKENGNTIKFRGKGNIHE